MRVAVHVDVRVVLEVEAGVGEPVRAAVLDDVLLDECLLSPTEPVQPPPLRVLSWLAAMSLLA